MTFWSPKKQMIRKCLTIYYIWVTELSNWLEICKNTLFPLFAYSSTFQNLLLRTAMVKSMSKVFKTDDAWTSVAKNTAMFSLY